MSFFADYGVFLLKTLTIVIAFIVIFATFFLLSQKEKQEKGKLEVTYLNEKYKAIIQKLKAAVLSKGEFKTFMKLQSSEKKKKKKTKTDSDKPKKKIFVLNFQGDIKASDTLPLTETINAVLNVAEKKDEVLLRLESQGGLVHAYGLAAAQLQRITEAKIPLTVAVDKVAASGGYMMACVANKILAAPFAIVGSIGVLAQIPNFHRFMQKHDVDFEQITGGKFKRTLTLFGKNTDEGRRKFQEDVNEIHHLFKDFIHHHRPQVDIEKVATGEHWQAEKAKDFKLVDELMTSDAYLLSQLDKADLYEVQYVIKKSLGEKIGFLAHQVLDRLFMTAKQKETESDLL
jgi:serine protease SohB